MTQHNGTPPMATTWKEIFGAGNPLTYYERVLVPRLFTPWAELLCERLSISPRDRVLDVATGTGAVAQVASAKAGPSGSVTGIDLTPTMLAIAKQKAPVRNGAPIEYIEGDAMAMTVDDGAFDVVTCQQGMQFFADRAAAAREMLRVLESGGRVGVAVWRSVDNIPPFAAMATAIREVAGGELADRFTGGPFGFPDPDALRDVLSGAGFSDVRVSQESLPFVFEGGPSQVFELLTTAPPQMGLSDLSAQQHARMFEVVTESLAAETVDGAVRSHSVANIAIARKR